MLCAGGLLVSLWGPQPTDYQQLMGGQYAPLLRAVLLGLVGIAGVLSLAEWLWVAQKIEGAVDYDGAQTQRVRSALVDIRQRTEAFLLGKEANISEALDELLRGALLLCASDMHLSPRKDEFVVTYRVDGTLHHLLATSPDIGLRIGSRIKVISKLDPYARRPQDGSLRRKIGRIDLEARVSCLPANFGERLVLRMVRTNEKMRPLEGLGFDVPVTTKLASLLQKSQGIIYVSGPVGSGKTTTLYSSLEHLHQTRGETTSLVSLEDPIERQLPYVTQTEIRPEVGLGFPDALRSALRQDPGALMVGEVRDAKTAEIATQAGLTGHLILTTLHVRSAAGTFSRLLDMGIEPVLLADSCAGALAQRLLRLLCDDCKKPAAADEATLAALAGWGLFPDNAAFFEAVGCAACEGQGYRGRRPIGEVLLPSDKIRSLIVEKASADQIEKAARSEGMVPLRNCAFELACSGQTSLSEVLRVAQ